MNFQLLQRLFAASDANSSFGISRAGALLLEDTSVIVNVRKKEGLHNLLSEFGSAFELLPGDIFPNAFIADYIKGKAISLDGGLVKGIMG